MAQQIPRIQSMWVEAKRRTPLVNLISIVFAFWILVASIQRTQSATCPNSVPSSAAITTEQSSISSTTITYGVAGGLVSNSLYYMYYLPSTSAIVRKVDVSDQQTWIASFTFEPNSKSLSVDAGEKTVYLTSWTSPLIVLWLSTSNGAITSQQSL